MKSVCIKTNNTIFLDSLFDSLKDFSLENTCFSCNEFKCYKNIIIHYSGKNIESFLLELSSVLSYLIIDIYEEKLLKTLIYSNYFYFSSLERKQILDTCFELLADQEENYSITDRHNVLLELFYIYLLENKNMVLDGVINFRLKDYFKILDFTVDLAVNKFIVEREYVEFISLLKLYISSQDNASETVHLVYNDSNSILLDENKNLINVQDFILNAKYLSDISFSSNDYILNTLLTILPEKIYIHLINDSIDEFINTLMLIFENRIQICNNCSICKIYKTSNNLRQLGRVKSVSFCLFLIKYTS